MKFEQTKINGLYIITPECLEDSRGFFSELYRQDAFMKGGIDFRILQENLSVSKKGVVRGLHFQWDPPLGKLMSVVGGSAFMTIVDIRKKSPTFCDHVDLEISSDSLMHILAPAGTATGFCALSENTVVLYRYNAFYNPDGESNILWSDQELSIPWPIRDPILSVRDREARPLSEWLRRRESDVF